MDNQILLTDSLRAVYQTIELTSPSPEKSALDITCTIATVVIALVNIILVIYIFRRNNRTEIANIERNRKLSLLKTLVLDYHMDSLYLFFDKITDEASKLKTPKLVPEAKKRINQNLMNLGSDLRQRFADPLLGIDQELYNRVLNSIDNLIDSLTESIFDEGINLYADVKYKELIADKIANTKTNIIKTLFSYSGE